MKRMAPNDFFGARLPQPKTDGLPRSTLPNSSVDRFAITVIKLINSTLIPNTVTDTPHDYTLYFRGRSTKTYMLVLICYKLTLHR